MRVDGLMKTMLTILILAASIGAAYAAAGYGECIPGHPGHPNMTGGHPDGAEITVRHFMGKKNFNKINLSHGDLVELVENNPKWKAWEKTLICDSQINCNCHEPQGNGR
jgi:hypothetical protein